MQIRLTGSSKTLRHLFFVLGFVLTLLSGPLMAGESLDQRVQRYWTARAANDLQTMYSLESAALPGGWLTPDQSGRLRGLPVRDVEILETKIEGDKAAVKIQGRVAVGSLGWMPQTLYDQWVLVNGEWYHQTDKPE